jgi:transglutaminase-like putative cysteine protease
VNLYKAFRVSSMLMIAIGLLVLAWSAGSVFYMLVALTGVVLAWVYEDNPVMGRSTSTAAALFCVAYAPLDYLMVSLDIIVAMAHLLILLQVIKLLAVKKNRDYLQMFLISLIQLAVAAVLTIDIFFFIPFIAYLVFATWTLILFHLKREYERSLRLAGEGELPETVKVERTRGVITPSFFIGSTSICFVTLLLTSVFFAIMPRLSASLLPYALRPMRVSGFSESIDLGISGEITPGETEVMKVELLNVEGPSVDLACWRGVALSHYDGVKWRKFSPEEVDAITLADIPAMTAGRTSYTMTLQGGKRVFDLMPFKETPQNTLVQRIWQSPLDTKVLFGMHPIYRIEFRSQEAPNTIEVDALGSVYNKVSQYGIIGYDVYSLNLDPESPELETAVTYPVVDEIDYMQLPTPGRGFQYNELKEFAEGIISKANAKTPYEKVRAIESHLFNNYSYTRNITRTPDVEPVYDFLFNQKSGHCELFASAMAVLLRTVGIPARVVNGYRGGQWVPYGSFYIVRQKDAHCWVEVFFDRDRDPLNRNEIGWVRFDPTPPAILEGGGFFAPVTNFISYLRLKWIDYVIAYSAVEQRKIALELRDTSMQMRGWVSRVFKSLKDFFSGSSEDTRGRVLKVLLYAIPPAVGLIALIVLLRGRKKRRRARKKLSSPSEVSVRFYRDLLKALEHAGLRRGYSQTPSEFARVVASTTSSIAGPTWAVTEKFLEVRFGGREMGREEIKVVSAAIERVRIAIRAMRAARRTAKRQQAGTS